MDFYDMKAKLLNFLCDIRIYKGGFVLFGNSSYNVKGPDMRQVLNIIKPGDVLLRRYSHYIGSITIPGYFSHVALYVGDDKVIHMLGCGVVTEDILTFLRCDDVAILRMKKPDTKVIKKAIKKAKEYLDSSIPYDYNFETDDSSKMYCTEMVDAAYGNPIGDSNGNKKIIPDAFLKCNMFQMIWRKGWTPDDNVPD